MTQTAKVFWSGRSQAVRLPKAFRLDAKEVNIRRQGHALVLEPVADDWAWLDGLADIIDDEFIAAVNEQPPMQERPEIEDYFK